MRERSCRKSRARVVILGGIVALSVLVTGAEAAMRKGPYLIYPGNNTQMTVLWQLNVWQSCTLEWGLDTTYSAGSVVTNQYGTDRQHRHTITGLTPGAKYYYRVTEGANHHTGSFRAAPPADATSVKFLAYGDTRSYPSVHDMVNAGMVATYTGDPDYQTIVLHSGDWVSDGDEEADWTDQFFGRTRTNTLAMQANVPINGCRGNHEDFAIVYRKYWPYPYVSPCYWSFDYGPAHIVVIDQYRNYSPGSAQLTWIENDLAASDKPWKFLLYHEPGWGAGTSHANNAAVQTRLQPLCETYGVDIVIAGHNHNYARCGPVNGVWHITSGGGGAPLSTPNLSYPYVVTAAKEYHFCKIDIQDNRLTLTAVKSNGTVLDTFTITHDVPVETAISHWELYD